MQTVLSLAPASQWILSKFIILEENLEENLENLELGKSVDQLYKFLWDDFANWYVEYLKIDNAELPFAKNLFKNYIIKLSPYAPFETEALWREFFDEEELLAFTFSQKIEQKYNLEQKGEFAAIIKFVEDLRSLRGLFAIDPAQNIQVFSTDLLINKYADFVRFVARAQIINEQKSELYLVQRGEYTYSLDILAYIEDKPKEIKRTEKLTIDLEKQIKALQMQLDNPKFLEAAESEVIEEKKQNLQDRQGELLQQKKKMEFLNVEDK